MYNKSSRVNCAMKLPALALKIVLALSLFCAVAVTSSAQTLTTLNKFRGTNGANPYAPLVQGTNGFLYGTTYFGGVNNTGTVFKMSPGGKLTTIYSFMLNGHPSAGLVQATNGNFYGTALFGGSGSGAVFAITPSGTLTTLYPFCLDGGQGCTDGELPFAPLIQGTDGNFYGTTSAGGANNGGTIFKITLSGTFTTLYSLCSKGDCADGENSFAGLVQAGGIFYGTTRLGGAHNAGTVFKLTPSGKLTTLYNFCSVGLSRCTDGAEPFAGLLLATDGNFYGTTFSGGPNDGGTIFKMTPGGVVTTLYAFCSQGPDECTDGLQPYAGLIQATDGNLYGTTTGGGAFNHGTAFQITSSGKLTSLYSFCSQSHCPDGSQPYAGLSQGTDGNFYGTTLLSWAPLTQETGGIVYRLSTGLEPFVETLPTFGRVGGTIKILGTNLSSATGVSFNGTPAAFKVISSSLIMASVPTGAVSGSVAVTTPSTILTSNQPFSVKP